MNMLVNVAALATASTAIADTAINPDAELLALGTQLEPIIAEWIEFRANDASRRAAWRKACLDADLPRLDPGSFSDDEVRERDDARRMVHYIGKNEEEADLDEHGGSIKLNSIHDPMFPLCDDILSRRATTAPGLGVQARAVSLCFPELWDSDCDHDAEEVAKRSFIESVAAFSGVIPVPVEEAALSGVIILEEMNTAA